MKQKTMSFQKRVFCILIGFTILTLSVVSAVSCYISFQNTTALTSITSTQLVEKSAAEVDRLFENMYLVCRTITRDIDVQNILRKEYPSYVSQINDQFDLDMKLSELNLYNEEIFAIYILGENGIASKSKYYSFANHDITTNEAYLEACQLGKTVWTTPQEGSQFAITTGDRLIASITPIIDIYTGLPMGAVVVEMQEMVLQNTLSAIGEHGYVSICDSTGEPLIWPDFIDLVGDTIQPPVAQKDMFSFFTEDMIVVTSLSQNDWMVSGVANARDLTQSARNILVVVTMTCMVMMLLSIAVAFRVSHWLVHPILQLNEEMHQVEQGDFDVALPSPRDDEIGQLSSRFYTMIQTIQGFMKKEKEDLQRLRRAELKALQAQIQPHFLYNTLDSVIWMARDEDYPGIIKMVTALTRFLKISLSRGREIITLEEELAHAKNYLVIQNIRYKDQFTYHFEVPEVGIPCDVPKLILQPLIENAIYHGIKLKRGTCRLVVAVEVLEDTVHIAVCDNGVGMDEQRAQRLENTLRNHPGPKLESFGCVNVNQRLEMFFGTQWGLKFETQEQEGTKFHIYIPKDWRNHIDEGIIG